MTKESIKKELKEMFSDGLNPKEAVVILQAQAENEKDMALISSALLEEIKETVGKIGGETMTMKEAYEQSQDDVDVEDCNCNCNCEAPKYAFVVEYETEHAHFRTADSKEDIIEFMKDNKITEQIIVFRRDCMLEVAFPIKETPFKD